MLNPFHVNWTRIPRNSVVGKFLRFWLNLVPRRAVVRILGGANRGMKWTAGSSLNSCWLGTYEIDSQRAIVDKVKPGMVAYDIGANAGFYTLFFSRLVGDAGRVYAIEPLPANIRMLAKHISLNGLVNVTILPLAADSKQGMVPFDAANGNSMARIGVGETRLTVPAWSLDDLVSMGIPPPDFVKIDAEGAEAQILAGGSKLLAGRKCQWIISLHSEELANECAGIMERNGYQLKVIGIAKRACGGEYPEVIYCWR